jgi:hypothetical protein
MTANLTNSARSKIRHLSKLAARIFNIVESEEDCRAIA